MDSSKTSRRSRWRFDKAQPHSFVAFVPVSDAEESGGTVTMDPESFKHLRPVHM